MLYFCAKLPTGIELVLIFKLLSAIDLRITADKDTQILVYKIQYKSSKVFRADYLADVKVTFLLMFLPNTFRGRKNF